VGASAPDSVCEVSYFTRFSRAAHATHFATGLASGAPAPFPLGRFKAICLGIGDTGREVRKSIFAGDHMVRIAVLPAPGRARNFDEPPRFCAHAISPLSDCRRRRPHRQRQGAGSKTQHKLQIFNFRNILIVAIALRLSKVVLQTHRQASGRLVRQHEPLAMRACTYPAPKAIPRQSKVPGLGAQLQ
jgi:hypothetical protein